MDHTSEPPPPAEPVIDEGITQNARTYGMLCHLCAMCGLIGIPFGNILGPLVIWLIKKPEDPFIDFCGKEALNFQISWTVYTFALTALMFFAALLPFIGPLLAPMVLLALIAIVIANIIYVIVASIKSNEGTAFVYPLTIQFLK